MNHESFFYRVLHDTGTSTATGLLAALLGHLSHVEWLQWAGVFIGAVSVGKGCLSEYRAWLERWERRHADRVGDSMMRMTAAHHGTRKEIIS